MSSRLALDRFGRQIVVVTAASLWLDVDQVFVVLDGRQLGLLPTQARPPDARERRQTAKTFYDSTSGKRARQEQLEVPDDELDEAEAIRAAMLEERRTPPDLLNVAA
jgi:hypothetical protein